MFGILTVSIYGKSITLPAHETSICFFFYAYHYPAEIKPLAYEDGDDMASSKGLYCV